MRACRFTKTLDFERLLDHSITDGKIADQFLWDMASWRRATVSSTENGLGLVTMPSTEGGVPDGVGSFMVLF